MIGALVGCVAAARTVVEVGGDPLFSSVLLLLHGDSGTVADSSSYARNATVVGSVSSSSYGSPFGGSQHRVVPGGAAYWSGLTLTADGTYTIEGFFTFAAFSSPRSHIFGCWGDGGENGWTLDVTSSGSLVLAFNWALAPQAGSATLATDTRYHLALVLTVSASSTTGALYVDGENVVTFSAAALGNRSSVMRIGNRSDSTLQADFYFEEFRVTEAGRYTAPFDVPTTAYPDGAGGSAHRYWRWVNFQIPGAYFEISELRVVDGSGTRYAATMTASTAPDFGTLASLADSDTESRPYWAASTAEDSGFWIQADLGSAQPVAGMQMASYDTSDRFPSDVTLQWSDDGSSWTTFGTWAGLTYPGDKTWDSVLTPWVEFVGSEYPNVYAEQSYVVPVSASTLVFEMWGGSGKSSGAGGLGGAGAYLRGEFPVTPGETLTLGVAGVPEFETALSCAGGGSSAILRGSTVIAVAAGGGGACWDVDGTSGGDPDASTGPTGSGGGATQSTPGAAGSELYGGQAGLGDGTGGYGSRVPLPETVSFSSGGTGWSYGGGSLYVAGSPASGGGGGGGYKGGGGGGIGGSGGGGSSYFSPSVIGGTYTEGSPGFPAGSGSQNFDLNIANGVYGKICLRWKP